MAANKSNRQITFPKAFSANYSAICIHNGSTPGTNSIYCVTEDTTTYFTARVSSSYSESRGIKWIACGY